MAGRSSTRHVREVQGRDSAEHEAGEFDEYNDFTAKGVAPNTNASTAAPPEEPDDE